MKTILTKSDQEKFLNVNWQLKTITHKWSARGYGNSKIIDDQGNVLSKASGCGYDRYGAALGQAICELFPNEVLKLAKRECKGKNKKRKSAEKFYGLFYNSVEGEAWLDGACGHDCMNKVLNKIGFELERVAESERTNNGEVFYRMIPVSKHTRQFI